MTKPLIGLTPLYDIEQEKVWMRPNYMQAIIASGGIPLILPLTCDKTDIHALARLCDGFLFTGGPDVHPALFGEETLRYCGAINEKRDTLEILLLKEADRLDKPVLGICRGIQLINVAFGGSLYQDIPAQVDGVPIAHDQQRPYDVPVHTVSVEQESPLGHIINKEELMVNSMHHQAVKDLAPALKCAAKSKDGLIEGVYMPGRKFFLAVQWHPEYLWQGHQDQQKIIAAFVDASKS
jgi:putative glutamine amidotransferase